MKKKALLAKKDYFYIPAYDEDREILKGIKQGELISCSISDVRSLLYHRRYFKMLQEVIKMMPEHLNSIYKKPEHIISDIKEILGMYDTRVNYRGDEVKDYHSISFAKMGQKRFEQFYNDSCDIILNIYLPEISLEDFNKHIRSLM